MKKELVRKVFAVTISATTLLSMVGCKPKEDGSYILATRHTPPQEVYTLMFEDAMGRNIMPVGSYAGPHANEREYKGKIMPSMVSKEYFDLYKEMGLNFFTSTLGVEEKTEEFLTLCDEYNMGAFITFSQLNGPDVAPYVTEVTIENCLDQFADHKSLLGFYLRDEPTTKMIDKLENTVDCLDNSVYADDMYAYANALPEYSKPDYYDKPGSAMSWEQYLEYYCEKLKVEYLSFDFYPWYINQDGIEYYNSGYIKALSVSRKVANKYKIPVWSCKQCGSIFDTLSKDLQKVTPNENQFRWQMTIDLAYGVKGFTYFLLCGDNLGYDTKTDSEGNPIWEEGIDDYFGVFNAYTGEPNVWFYYAKEFDAHLSQIEGVLMNAYHDGIIVSGAVAERNNMGEEVIESGKYHELVGVTGTASLIGCYNYRGQTVLYVTNNSYKKDGKVTLEFDNKYAYNVYQGAEKSTKTGKSLTLDLLPGEGAMVMLQYQ